MKSVAVVEPGKLAIVELPEPKIGPYDALVRVEAAFMCNATDSKVVDGHFPGLGMEHYPLLLGHENVGRVVEVGKKVTTFKVGKRVVGGLLLEVPDGTYGSGWGGFSQYVIARDHKAMVADKVADKHHGWDEIYQIMLPVPDDIGLDAAGLLCTWREVYAGMFTDFGFKPTKHVVIFGSGPVGLSFVKFAKLKNMGKVIVLDPLETKRNKALQMGADAAYAPDEAAFAQVKKLFPDGVDYIVDAVGLNTIIQSSVPLIRMGGSICVYGVIGNPIINFDKSVGPYNFNVLIHQWPTRTAEAAAQDVLIDWIRNGLVKSSEFVTDRYPVDELPQVIKSFRHPNSIKTMIDFSAWV
ncbi:MAG: zinc-binding dehydrogenase [Sphaerochaetaceae bacterium]|nr:zinc-binding dehydrogenase [Sphaerochaetaceae bacterium]